MFDVFCCEYSTPSLHKFCLLPSVYVQPVACPRTVIFFSSDHLIVPQKRCISVAELKSSTVEVGDVGKTVAESSVNVVNDANQSNVSTRVVESTNNDEDDANGGDMMRAAERRK